MQTRKVVVVEFKTYGCACVSTQYDACLCGGVLSSSDEKGSIKNQTMEALSFTHTHTHKFTQMQRLYS
jgi:hypothetical protein